MCKCCNLLFPMFAIVVGVLLLASNYGYSDGYYVQSWWPTLFVIAGVSRIAKQFCCNKYSCSSEESKGGK